MAGNTAPIHGKICRIEKNSVLVAYSADWSINASLDMADKSALGDSWKTALPGMGAWDGSMTFHLVMGNTEQKALHDSLVAATPGTLLTDVEFNLEDTGDYYSGNIYLTSLAVVTGIGDIVKLSFNFQGDGALTLTVA